MPKKKKKQQEDEGPKAKTIYSIKLEEEQMDRLAERLDDGGAGAWFPYDVAYSLFAFKGEGVNVVGYQSGKVVVQGKKTEDFVRDILEAEITGDPRLGYDEVHNPEWFEPHVGMDESGKGDLFGPLVAACVVADGDMVRKWMEEGIADSKKLTDKSILRLEKIIRGTKGVVITTAYASMGKYNALYKKFGSNLNRLLAWFYGKALNEALDQRSVEWGLLDQFSKQRLVDPYLKDREGFELQMRTKAESDPVVAAASVIARAVYVRGMDYLSQQAGVELCKGASGKVREQAAEIVERFGDDKLGDFAKLHFRTAFEARGLEPPAKKEWRK